MNNKKTTKMNITVIGIGKLGLGFALLLEEKGHKVCGVDINQPYIDLLNSKIYQTKEPGLSKMVRKSKNFHATTDLKEGLEFSDLVFIIVQTPNSGGDKFYDHTILSNLLLKINKHKIENKDLIIGCTVMPKYINQIGAGLISDCKNTYLSYNPEFVAQGDIVRGFRNPDIVLLGTNHEELKPKIKNLYKTTVEKDVKWAFMKPLDAEIVKITLNGFITTKLSFANMISDACDNVGGDKHVVLDAVGGDSRIGNKYFRPGNSFGGPCFPRDTKALLMFIEQSKINGNLLRATTEYNEEHIKFQVQVLLDQNLKEYVIRNVCFKEDSKVPIIEESAKLKIAKSLYDAGKKVIIEDEIGLINETKKEFGNIFQYRII
jgi:nucleotide sugar dehydrogenase